MGDTSKKSFGLVLVQIALAVLFAVMGLQLLGLRGAFFTDAGDVSKAVYHLFGRGDIGNIVKIAVGVVFLIAGVMMIVSFFTATTSSFNKILKLIILVIWIVVAVIKDIIPGITVNCVWLSNVSYDLLIIGALLAI